MKVTELTYCLGNPKEITLLDYWWLGRVLLLGEGRQNESRADGQSD
jgi:hypothetical protein